MAKRILTLNKLVTVFEIFFLATLVFYVYWLIGPSIYPVHTEESSGAASLSPFIYSFNVPGNLYETGDIEDSRSSYWWVNSGGILKIENGVGKTNQGEMGLSRWRILYNLNNSKDTDGGLHPQNIFRLISRGSWYNFSGEIYFKVNKYNLSESPNRNISNGVFLMSRYRDGNNLYYAGVRVDGTAVIKKKINGEYFTMAQEKIWNGREYDRNLNPSLLPQNKWLGIRSEVKDEPGNKVSIKLFLDENQNGKWKEVLEAEDDGKTYGGKSILGSGNVGLRSDFMDLEFKDFKVTNL